MLGTSFSGCVFALHLWLWLVRQSPYASSFQWPCDPKTSFCKIYHRKLCPGHRKRFHSDDVWWHWCEGSACLKFPDVPSIFQVSVIKIWATTLDPRWFDVRPVIVFCRGYIWVTTAEMSCFIELKILRPTSEGSFKCFKVRKEALMESTQIYDVREICAGDRYVKLEAGRPGQQKHLLLWRGGMPVLPYAVRRRQSSVFVLTSLLSVFVIECRKFLTTI